MSFAPKITRSHSSMHARHSISWVLMFMLSFNLMGCQVTTSPLPIVMTRNVRSVKEVQTQVELGSTLYVRGVVGDRIPLVNGQVYELQDDTGQIWVVTNDTTITTGETLLIQGKVAYEATPEFGPNAGERYLWEVAKVERSP